MGLILDLIYSPLYNRKANEPVEPTNEELEQIRKYDSDYSRAKRKWEQEKYGRQKR